MSATFRTHHRLCILDFRILLVKFCIVFCWLFLSHFCIFMLCIYNFYVLPTGVIMIIINSTLTVQDALVLNSYLFTYLLTYIYRRGNAICQLSCRQRLHCCAKNCIYKRLQCVSDLEDYSRSSEMLRFDRH